MVQVIEDAIHKIGEGVSEPLLTTVQMSSEKSQFGDRRNCQQSHGGFQEAKRVRRLRLRLRPAGSWPDGTPWG